MKRLLPIPWLVLLAVAAHAQTLLQGRLLDAATGEPLLFGSIGIAHSERGTLSNEEGYFSLQASPGDTLLVSFVGYRELRLPATGFPAHGQLYLKSNGISLKTATITAPDFLYVLLAKCKKAPAAPTHTAKTYFGLNAYIGDQPIEMLEMYYNGVFSGPHIDALHLKAGRIFLASYLNGFFLNMETSKAVSMLNLLTANPYFPQHPLHLAKTSLPKAYRVFLENTYRDSGTVYQVEFIPRDSTGGYFAGQVWIDSASNRIRQLRLHVPHAKTHPFRAQWPGDSLLRVDMDLTYRFKNRGGQYVFDVVTCTYRLTHKGRGGIRPITVECLLRAYDHDTQFVLPLLTYDPNLSDYRKMTLMPHNPYFWANRDSLVPTGRERYNRNFFRDLGVSFNYPDSWRNPHRELFSHNMVPWHAQLRLHMQDYTDTVAATPAGIPAQQYRLRAQLYMDINPKGSGNDVMTTTLFDVYDTYYRLPTDSLTDCFLNLFFDLYEIQRLALEKDLQPGLDVQTLTALHKQHSQTVDELAQRYLREVERGQNRPALQKWNLYVLDRLGIDNMAQFGLDQSRTR